METGLTSFDLKLGAPPRPLGAPWRRGEQAIYPWGEVALVRSVFHRPAQSADAISSMLELNSPEAGVREVRAYEVDGSGNSGYNVSTIRSATIYIYFICGDQ